MKSARLLAAATAFGFVLAGSQAAFAFTAVSSADLNLRTGPGPQYQVVAMIGRDDKINVQGCLKEVTWCNVTWGDQSGWASADYIVYDGGNGPQVLPLAGDEVDIPLVTYEAVDEVAPQFVGAMTPVNGVVEAITPPTMVSAYVSEQTVDQVLVSGEVVVGSGVAGDRPALRGSRVALSLRDGEWPERAGREGHPQDRLHLPLRRAAVLLAGARGRFRGPDRAPL